MTYAALIVLSTRTGQETVLYHHFDQARAEAEEVNTYARIKQLPYRAAVYNLTQAEERASTLMDFVAESELDAQMLERQGWERGGGLWNGPQGQTELPLHEALLAASSARGV